MKKLKDKMMVFMYKKMISCQQASFLSSKNQHHKLSFKENMSLKLHLMSCKFCRIFEYQIQFIVKGAKSFMHSSNKSSTSFQNLPKKKKEEIKQNIQASN